MNDTYKLRSVGGALMVTIPQHAARLLRFNKGDEVKITIAKLGEGGALVVERAKKTRSKTK